MPLDSRPIALKTSSEVGVPSIESLTGTCGRRLMASSVDVGRTIENAGFLYLSVMRMAPSELRRGVVADLLEP